MKELLRKIDAEFGFQLSEDEMERILKEVEQGQALFDQLNAIDISGKTPFVRLDLRRTQK